MEPLRPRDPKAIGPYKTVGRLGAGGMGVVYLAIGETGMAAIKTVGYGESPGFKDRPRFEREVASQRLVKSPFVATVIDSDMDGDGAWIAMEYVSGQNLSALLSEGQGLSKNLWWSFAMGCASALATTSRAGLIHRDVKPANIILSNTGPKLVDFGIARNPEETSITVSGSVTGSPAWLSPEQLDDLELSTAVDIFSLAAVLYYCNNGTSPWGTLGKSSTSAFMKAISDSEPSFEGFDSDQIELLAPMLSKKPSERPSALEVGTAIREIAEDHLALYFAWLEIHRLGEANLT